MEPVELIRAKLAVETAKRFGALGIAERSFLPFYTQESAVQEEIDMPFASVDYRANERPNA